VLRYLHSLSAVLFYLLGSSFFVAFLLLRRDIGGTGPLLWLQVGDLPLLLSGILYGGISVIRSFQGETPVSILLLIAIALPLLVLFGTAAVLTFGPVWS
jgi:hypothetical protein